MSKTEDGKPLLSAGRRKDGQPFKEGNTRPDGSYDVGRNRTPEETRFKKNDGRPRGRRPKGVRNIDSEFERELRRKVTVREDGKERVVSKSLSIDLRLIDNAGRKGQNVAIAMVDERRQRIAAAKEETARRYHSLSDAEILDQYIRERAAELQVDPGLFGDAIPDADVSGEDEHG